MSEAKPDGGPAFPTVLESQDLPTGNGNCIYSTTKLFTGMSLRQWYAGQALTSPAGSVPAYGETYFQAIARDAFAQADAMIAHEEKERLEEQAKLGSVAETQWNLPKENPGGGTGIG